MKKISIAIDGYSACGKSTLAKDLANKLEYKYIDSGAMYRAVTLFAIQNNIFSGSEINREKLFENLKNIDINFKFDEKNQNLITLNHKVVEYEIRTMEISNMVSKISTISEVRKEMVKIQQRLGYDKGIVMDGRDIGTVVFPNAELKLFITAGIKVRVERRYLELKAKNEIVSLSEIEKNLLNRDFMDSTRKDSPLIQAKDAIIIDNSELSKEEQLNIAYQLAIKAINL